MGKPKKGKKSTQDDEFISDGEEEVKLNKNDKKDSEKSKDNMQNEFTDISNEGNKKSKKKKSKTKDDDSDIDQISKEIEDMEFTKKKTKSKKISKQISDDDSDDETEQYNKKNKSKKTQKKHVSDDESDAEEVTNKKLKSKKSDKLSKKTILKDSDNDSDDISAKKSQKSKKPTGGFALLEVDSEPEEMQSNAQPESDGEIQITTKKGTKKNQVEKDAGGKKSKKKKRRDDSDEDIEKVLAELELEYSGGKKETVEENTELQKEEEPVEKRKIKTKGKSAPELAPEPVPEEIETQGDDDGEISGTVKTAAQKKKEKKEREKAKKLATKKSDIIKKQLSTESEPSEAKELSQNTDATKNTEDASKDDDNSVSESKDAKKKKKSAKDEKESKTKKGPGSKTIAAMQEALKKLKEEEERLKREEEERIKREEEAETMRLEQLRLEQERKDKKKKKEKERKERLKAEGKLLTLKQKADRARAQAMIEALKAQGVDMPDVGEKKPRPGTRIRTNKLKKESSQEKSIEEQPKPDEVPEEKVEVEIIDKSEEKDEEDDVKDAWDADSSEEEPSEETKEISPEHKSNTKPDLKNQQSVEENDSDSDNEKSSDESSKESEDEIKLRSDIERKRAKALTRIQTRREDAERNKSPDELRAAVVCVLGHVDTGKTKILDKLRRTNVQDGEAGGITQQIGATNVPMENIQEQTKIVKGFDEKSLKLPGLLIIDTPGHESFSNLRSRGSSLCDIAILVVDIMHGLEPQTIESINLLKSRRTPFVVALNKIDRLYDWQTISRKDVRDVLKAQASHTQLEFENRTKEVIVQFAEQSLNAALFYENPDPRTYISLIPTSAITGEGMGNILALIVDFCQTHLAKRLMYSSELQATVLEVKAIPGLGTTIDAILINGLLREGDTMILAGTDGPIVTQIRSLLMPQPMRELRVKNAYKEFKEIKAAQGVKIAAKELEKAIAGLNLVVAQYPDEVDIMKEEVAHELKSALSSIKLQERGVFVQASTLGSLEALLDFLKSSKIPYAGIRIGPVVKKDVMKASIMLEHDSQYACILAFDVKVEHGAQELADSLGVKIFQADIIYHLFDAFTAHREELKRRKREEFRKIAVFPCKFRVLPQFVFNSRDPIVVGVMVEAGIVREGTPICVPSKEFVELGIVTSIENNHKQVDSARKGMEVCVKIEPIPGESPKMFGRHFDETDMLVSKISRQSIDACKDYFRDDLLKTDWQLMVELKNMFQIL